VPVSLQEVALDAPLRVRVVNAHPSPTVDEPVYVRVVRQPIIWQYDTISLRTDENVAATLSQRGASGWETTGISLPRADGGTTLVLKRSR
jgi:hypothetical protein